MASVNTLCKSVLNVKNTVIKNCNLYSDKNGVKHIRVQALVENAMSSRKFRHDIALNSRIKSTFAGIYQIPTYRLRK